MAWDIRDYNLASMKHKTDVEIEAEYKRISKEVRKDVLGFRKHKKANLPFVRSVVSAMSGNETRRQKEHAIISMKSFQMLDVHTYESWSDSIDKTIETWKEAGITNLSRRNIKHFLEFLDWVKSFQDYKYRLSDVQTAYEQAHHSVKGAMIIFANMQDDGLSNT